jgi:hypothetical protein
MDAVRTELEKRLKKKRAEVNALTGEIEQYERLIDDRKYRIEILAASIEELQSLYNLFPSESDATPQVVFRANSDGGAVHEILRDAGEPLYIDDILERLEREVTIESRGSLAGQLGGYVRKGQVFTRPAPNTFGLREWEVKADAGSNGVAPGSLPMSDATDQAH